MFYDEVAMMSLKVDLSWSHMLSESMLLFLLVCVHAFADCFDYG